MKTQILKLLTACAIFAAIASTPVAADPHEPTNNELMMHTILHQVMVFAGTKHVTAPEDHDGMWEGAINGMLQSLDQHSAYISPEDYKSGRMSSKEEFAGIGARLRPQKGGGLEIAASIGKDAPSAKAGLKPGDMIREVCNRESETTKFVCISLTTLNMEQTIDKIKGKAGTTVRLRIQRGTHLEFYDIVRAVVVVPVIYAATINDDTVYVRLTQFTSGASADLKSAFDEQSLTLTSRRATNVILDLRFNPGGLLTEAIQVVDAFVPGGRIVTTIGSGDQVMGGSSATPDMFMSDQVNLAVIINNFSASASEIVAGAVQDLKDTRSGKTVIVGETSFGKGSVQSVLPLPNGGAFKLTVARYYTGSGKTIDGVGVTPDVEVSLGEGESISNSLTGTITEFDTQLAKAIEVLSSDE